MHDDMRRPVATEDDKSFSLTIDAVAERYQAAGHPRTIRTLQRYCKLGHIDCVKTQTMLGDMYLVSPESVDRHLAQITELQAATPVATDRGQPRPVATSDAASSAGAYDAEVPATETVLSRPVATETPDTSRYVARLESENDFLRNEVGVKNTQIAALNERVRETNLLTQGLQRLLAPLLRSPQEKESPRDSAEGI